MSPWPSGVPNGGDFSNTKRFQNVQLVNLRKLYATLDFHCVVGCPGSGAGSPASSRNHHLLRATGPRLRWGHTAGTQQQEGRTTDNREGSRAAKMGGLLGNRPARGLIGSGTCHESAVGQEIPGGN